MYSELSTSSDPTYIGYAISRGVKEFTDAFIKDKLDIVLVTGDRVEMLAAATAAASLKIPMAHIHGGDVTENAQIDEQIRHALTKFAHLHFTATEKSKQRVLQMGEEDWRVFNVGSPSMDFIVQMELFSKEMLLSKLGLSTTVQKDDDIILCVQHPAIAESDKAGEYMREIIQALKKFGHHVILIYPNNDPGSELIISEIDRLLKEKDPHFHAFQNLDRKTYLSTMKYAQFMIGNSSSGFIDSALFHVPVINIGIRNKNRESSDNVIHVETGFDNIWKAILKATSKSFRQACQSVKNAYGDGHASERIVKELEEIEMNFRILNKKFVPR
jgi:UDP-hydrolysing UDP-N-acetyl-D-glucosamine 2-epimerase